MDDLDKEVDKRFEDVKCDETTTARQCATSFGDGVSFAETKYAAVKPAKSAKKEHEEFVASLKELREKVESTSVQDSDPVDAFFESVALDTTRVFFPALVIALVAGMTACGGDDVIYRGLCERASRRRNWLRLEV